ncbi:hypothetical protein ACTQ34_09315 [Agathobaculum sp. LCP25S3_E8]|uniref:hypothetical protein n=1 Tax=Agathobaculum sp. LCP25S3_E8 TaxID=3438735 RepID=UPI003F9132CE
MDLFHTDLTYFAERVPVVKDIGTIFFAVGWALLIGNLVFQAMRSMASGVGIEAEEPGRLFLRTAMFSFLLVVSRQICEIGLGFSSTIMDMLQIPNAITFDPFGEDTFDMLPNAGWIVVILVNVIIQWQTIKLFFEVAERYVILCVLTYCAPLAFAMGGSKSTGEIFRGWLRMFGSMCALIVFNLMFVKLLISAMSNAPNGTAIIPWMMLIVGIVRTAKKMDGIILRIGLNPALTGDPLGTRFPGMLTAMTLRSIAQMVTRTAAQGMPSAGHGSPAPPTSGSFMQHSGKQGSQSTSTVGASAQGGAAAGAAGVAGAAIHVAGSGARAMNDLASFRNRHGAGDPASIRQVSQAISVDADDWEDGSSVSSIRSQNQSVSEANAVSRMMVSPVSPALPPLPADFGRMSTPQTEIGTHAPVMPMHRADTAPGLSVTPVQPAAAMPHIPEQVFPSNTETSGAPQQPVSGTPSAHPPVQPTTSRPARVTPVSPVSPPHVQTLLHSESNLSEMRTGYTEQNAPERPPVSPTESAGHSSSVVPTAAVAAATAVQGHTASAVQPNRTTPAASSGLTVSPPSRAMPPMPHVQQATQQAGQIPSADVGSLRVTPVAPAASTSGQSIPRTAVRPAPQTTVQPPSPAMRTQAPTAPAVSPASSDGGSRPAGSPVAPAPDRRPAVSPSRREHSEIQQTTTVQSNVPPSIRTPDMVGRPQIADKTRRLRRSAQPLNNKVTPQEGGKHHKRRKKK